MGHKEADKLKYNERHKDLIFLALCIFNKRPLFLLQESVAFLLVIQHRSEKHVIFSSLNFSFLAQLQLVQFVSDIWAKSYDH